MPIPYGPVTPESVAYHKAKAAQEREEVDRLIRQAERLKAKDTVAKLTQLFGKDAVIAWATEMERLAQPSPGTISDPRR